MNCSELNRHSSIWTVSSLLASRISLAFLSHFTYTPYAPYLLIPTVASLYFHDIGFFSHTYHLVCYLISIVQNYFIVRSLCCQSQIAVRSAEPQKCYSGIADCMMTSIVKTKIHVQREHKFQQHT